MPGLSKPIQDGHIGYHIKPGGHAMIEDDRRRHMDFFEKHR